MMGAFQFVRAAHKAGIKPIVGAELNVCRDHADRSQKDDGYPIVLLAKNRAGYHRLAKLCSLAYTDGFYYVPRIDRELLLQYKEDLIVLTRALQRGAEPPAQCGRSTGRRGLPLVEGAFR